MGSSSAPGPPSGANNPKVDARGRLDCPATVADRVRVDAADVGWERRAVADDLVPNPPAVLLVAADTVLAPAAPIPIVDDFAPNVLAPNVDVPVRLVLDDLGASPKLEVFFNAFSPNPDLAPDPEVAVAVGRTLDVAPKPALGSADEVTLPPLVAPPASPIGPEPLRSGRVACRGSGAMDARPSLAFGASSPFIMSASMPLTRSSSSSCNGLSEPVCWR